MVVTEERKGEKEEETRCKIISSLRRFIDLEKDFLLSCDKKKVYKDIYGRKQRREKSLIAFMVLIRV